MDLESLKRVLIALKGEAGKMKGEKLGRRFGKAAPVEMEAEAQPEMGLGEAVEEMPEEKPGGVTMDGSSSEGMGGGEEMNDEMLMKLLAQLK